MKFKEVEILVSQARIARYKAAYVNDERKTLQLYRANIRLSGILLAIIGMFEIILLIKSIVIIKINSLEFITRQIGF